ncbi:hypothetical protein [Roseovarius sp.]
MNIGSTFTLVSRRRLMLSNIPINAARHIFGVCRFARLRRVCGLGFALRFRPNNRVVENKDIACGPRDIAGAAARTATVGRCWRCAEQSESG